MFKGKVKPKHHVSSHQMCHGGNRRGGRGAEMRPPLPRVAGETRGVQARGLLGECPTPRVKGFVM